MKYKTFDHMNCSLAQTLNIIGERWTLLILRDAFFGARRFNQFERNLGISKNILSARLAMLVDEGILERREPAAGGHTEYALTEQGLDLQPVLLSMTHWGDKYRANPKGERITFVDRDQQRPIQRMSVRSEDGRVLTPKEIKATVGSGLDGPGLDGPGLSKSG
ncbi:transcriptional regulator [Halioglobus maricola]|uniref:Transcriptional regulator n=1 Tax=Halioglobus maricola TaxID=2601894 RepID=A0A5P9NJ75_9GAMM|nr:helix-turn-helix domain-containing protein [Halioglobus maricola]QFU75615.1 transcriptional regulator [Halioglobus maricola]